MDHKEKQKLTFDLICKAAAGDKEATEEIMAYYESYIIALSKIPFYNKAGEVCYRMLKSIFKF